MEWMNRQDRVWKVDAEMSKIFKTFFVNRKSRFKGVAPNRPIGQFDIAPKLREVKPELSHWSITAKTKQNL